MPEVNNVHYKFTVVYIVYNTVVPGADTVCVTSLKFFVSMWSGIIGEVADRVNNRTGDMIIQLIQLLPGFCS